MKTQKLVFGLLAAMALSWAQAVYAADNGTEFGIEDDLTVLGTGGTAVDPDAEVKGFTVFGATQSAYTGAVVGAGNVVVNGALAVSSGAYFVAGSTFASGAYFNSVSSFTTGAGSIYVNGGTTGQVLKKAADGSMYWAVDDQGGAGTINGTALRLLMIDSSGIGTVPSLFLQNANTGTNITMIAGSSMTILGDGTDGLGVTGATKLNGNTSVLGANTFTVGTGLTSLGGALNVTGVTTMTGLLSVNNSAEFGDAATKSTFSVTGALDMANNANITLYGTGKVTLPNQPAIGTDAANKDYVDSQIGSGGPWTRDNAISAVKLSTITDNVGIGIAVPVAKLQVSSANASASDMLLVVSSGTLASQQVLTANAAGDLMVKGNARVGDTVANTHGVNMAPAGDTALSVAGQNVSGDYAAKFYSGAALAAWIKKK